MNSSLLCLAVVFTAPATEPPPPSIYSLTQPFGADEDAPRRTVIRAQDPPIVIRGQTPGYDEMPGDAGVTSEPPRTYAVPPTAVPDGGLIVPNQTRIYQGTDPFLPGQPAGPVRGPGLFGVNGPQPYRLNRWVSRYDVGILPSSSASRGLGSFKVFEFDADWEYAVPLVYNWIFSFTQEFDLRNWEGPKTTPALPMTELPGAVYRFGWDLKLATPANYPLSALIAFNPSLNSDFQAGLSRDAWQFDGRGAIFWRPSPAWTWVGGAAFWDRVTDRVIPYAGVIYVPDDRWEWRIVFPDPRISYFLGQPWGFNTWFYARAEYHIESYEIRLTRVNQRDQVEIQDWRALMGFRFDNGWVTSFIEAGWVFGRNVDYKNAAGFDVASGFIGRMGIRF